jgi:hypothetical protein
MVANKVVGFQLVGQIGLYFTVGIQENGPI